VSDAYKYLKDITAAALKCSKNLDEMLKARDHDPIEKKREEVLRYLEALVCHWKRSGKSRKDALHGLVHSILAMIDGGAEVGPFGLTWEDENGEVHDLSDGELHSRWARRKP
jgi:hypothetical protein